MEKNTEKEKILIIDDDESATKLARFLMEKEGYEVFSATDGIKGLEKLQKVSPDLVLLDIDMPRMNGFQVCQKIRGDVLYRHLPIIMLTGSSEEDNLVKALGFGSDDYMLKPYKNAELVARVKGIMNRTTRVLDANPLTKMPGNIAISREIEKRIEGKTLFSVLYLDINKFKAFNDYYGFLRGDVVIKLTARIIIETVAKFGSEDDFTGHIGGDDFVIVTCPEKAVDFCSKIIEEFDGRIQDLYDEDDRKEGYILCKDRQGKENKFPLMTISIGVVSNERRKITHPGEISKIGAEVKKYAKTLQWSNYKIDNRIN